MASRPKEFVISITYAESSLLVRAGNYRKDEVKRKSSKMARCFVTAGFSEQTIGSATRSVEIARQHQLKSQFVGSGGHANTHAGFDTQDLAG